jgi:uncharacterized protein
VDSLQTSNLKAAEQPSAKVMEGPEKDVEIRYCRLKKLIEHAAHFLPSQGPITVFVHHNTLHSFEHLPFEEGVVEGGKVYGCHAFLPEDRYREKLRRGRIRGDDLEAVLLKDLGDEGLQRIGHLGSRMALRLAMLETPLHFGTLAELRWFISSSDALSCFLPHVDPSVKDRILDETKRWVMRDLREVSKGGSESGIEAILEGLNLFDLRSVENWNEKRWEKLTLHLLWQVVQTKVNEVSLGARPEKPVGLILHRDVLFERTGEDSNLLVHDWLIRFWSVFLDQGFSDWEIPNREAGAYQGFLSMVSHSFVSPTPFTRALNKEARRLRDSKMSALQAIDESLRLLGVTPSEEEDFILKSLLALRGWAGMVWQMETNAPWEPIPAPEGSLVDFLAIRLILERISLEQTARRSIGHKGPLDRLRSDLASPVEVEQVDAVDQWAFTIFEIAQSKGWGPEKILTTTSEEFASLIREVEDFPSISRRRIYHLAFERKYRNETLDALINHRKARRLALKISPGPSESSQSVAYQVVCCIDEREESFRRHLEEVDPSCETFGVAGFFGVAMYYRGLTEAHFRPLCPVNIKPIHYVVEEPLYSAQHSERRRSNARRRLGEATHRAHRGTRTFLGGFLTGLLGTLAVFPLVARILFPRSTARVRSFFGQIVKTPATSIRYERSSDEPGSEGESLGFSIDEMANIVEGGLRAIGMTLPEHFSPLVVICGHGSASLNNPQEAAHDCGACGGGRGGPNARAFSRMVNDFRVRSLLNVRGLKIPEKTVFIGGYHNTCDDGMTWYDLDYMPRSHHARFELARESVDAARMRSAHERCRRFESADLSISEEDALRHVEGRAEDLSQPRPEYGHCTNALCFVGRREWSRGLFLDRRAFLTSYDPSLDDERSSVLERLLQAVIPVCAGINLEYYFSYVDPTGYGCGTKLPHNITSLLGVMDGAASDLRPGLPWQMVELHEPVRLLFVIETTPEAIKRIIDDNEAIAQLVNGEWVQLAVFDSEKIEMQRYVRGRFEAYDPESDELPQVKTSKEWYRGWRDHLGFASINSTEVKLSSRV